MNRKIFIDTLFLIALINKQDQYHQKAVEVSKEYEEFDYLCTDAVLFEVGNALSKKYKTQAAQLINQLMNSDSVEIVYLTPKLFEQALNLYQQYQDKEWGLVDCLSFVVMKQYQLNQALTFDKHFIQAGFEALMR